MNLIKVTFTRYSAFILNGIIALILLLYFTNYFIDLGAELNIVYTLLLVLAITTLAMSYKQLLLYCLSFLIPVSVPFTIFSSAKISVPAELICVVLGGFFVARLILGTRLSKRFLTHPITIIAALDLLWLLITSISSQMPDVSFKRFVIRLCYYISFYYFYHELFRLDVKNIKRIFTLHICGFLIPIAYAMYTHALLGFTTVGSQRISAPFYFDHTIYGACLVFFIPFLIFHTLHAGTVKQRALYGALLLVFIAATVLSYSRAAWISLLLALCIQFILKNRIKPVYLLALAGLLALFALVYQQRIGNYFKENKEISHSNNIGMHLKSISNVNTDASNMERINRWKCALRMFADKPLVGFGPGTYQFFYGQYQQRQDLTRISTFNGTKGHAHSEYLNYLSETGLPGLLIFLALIVAVCMKGVKLFKHAADEQTKQIALYVFTGLLTFFIHGFFNGFLEFDKVAMPVFASYAALVALDVSQQNPQEI